MFLKVQLPWNVIISAENLDVTGLMLQRSIIRCLLDDFACKKASKTWVISSLGITFKLFWGEILDGVVHQVFKHGVFLRCGPVKNAYLSNLKLADHKYVPGENPVFMNDKLSKIGKRCDCPIRGDWNRVDRGGKGTSGVDQLGG
ncbi:hypothetical protein ACJRO7_031919 [Eucalyptus globulus]|uniref:Uncharacterized protein n=1 Tax=Eucalyptus globulus TaxID=34317 RepID=A0ABD3JIA3_EUCGL